MDKQGAKRRVNRIGSFNCVVHWINSKQIWTKDGGNDRSPMFGPHVDGAEMSSGTLNENETEPSQVDGVGNRDEAEQVPVEDMIVEDAGIVEITLGEDQAGADSAAGRNADGSKEGEVATGEDVLLPISVANAKNPKRRGKGADSSNSEAGEEWSGRTRSSGRSSRKKFDPDFCYDNSLAFAGGRKRAASNKSPAGASAGSNGKQSDSTVDLSKLDVEETGTSLITTKKPGRSGDPYEFDTATDERGADEKQSGQEKGSGSLGAEDQAMDADASPPDSPGKPPKKPSKQRAKKTEAESESSDDESTGSDHSKLYCICKKPHGNRFMISCDKCEEWFHGSCVGVTKNQGKSLQSSHKKWYCPSCRKKTAVGEFDATEPSKDTPTRQTSNDSSRPSSSATKTPGSPLKSGEKKTKDKSPDKKTSGSESHSKAKRPSLKPPVPAGLSGELKEFIQKQKSSASKHSKKPTTEEKPPVEADTTGLSFTTLGRPRFEPRLRKPVHVPPASAPSKARLFVETKHSPVDTKNQLFSVKSPPTTPVTSAPRPITESTKPKPLRKCFCLVCKTTQARENSLYCSSNCILQHGKMAIDLLPGTLDDPITVVDKNTGDELSVPQRRNLLAWLESHQTCYVPIPEDVLRRQEEKISQTPQDDPVRGTTKMMLKDHLVSRWRDAPDLQVDYTPAMIGKLVDEIEAGLFQQFKETSGPYKKKYRAIVQNIIDKKNDNFFRRLIRREIRPERVVDLTQEQMASDSMTQWRQNELKKDLELIIQTQTEELDHKPAVKKTHRGDEPISDEFVVEDKPKLEEARPDEEDRVVGRYDYDNSIKSNFSPAVTSPTASLLRMSSFSHGSSPQDSTSPLSDKPITSPDSLTASVRDTTDEHEDHIFDANCKVCNASMAGGGHSKDLGKYSSVLESKVKKEVEEAKQPPRLFYAPRTPMSYSSPTSFKVPTETPPDKRSKIPDSGDATSPTALSSPRSSTSDNSPDHDAFAAKSRGVIWEGEVHTQDLPGVKVEAFAMYGRAEETTKMLPIVLRQVGRIQPQQLWPYVEEVKPLKELTLITLKPAPGRVNAEFNSLHYFLTTRGRVSVIGHIPDKLKDFYIIALRENEALPEGLRLTGLVFEEDHPKLFVGIIIHHAAARLPPLAGRGLFVAPATSSSKKGETYKSPKTPDSAADSPVLAEAYEPSNPGKLHDPIVSRFLAIPASVKQEVSPKTPPPAEVADTSEPMDIEEDDKEAKPTPIVTNSAVVAAAAKTPPTPPVVAPNAVKHVAKKPAIPVDPRLARLAAAKPVDPEVSKAAVSVAEIAQPVVQPTTVATTPTQSVAVSASVPIPTPGLSASAAASSSALSPILLKTPVHLPPPAFGASIGTASVPQPALTTSTEKEDDGFGFSQKFIENLSKIQLPPGLKEALKSISTTTTEPQPTSSTTVQAPVSLPPPPIPHGGSLLGPGPTGPLLGVTPSASAPPPFLGAPPGFPGVAFPLNRPPFPPPGFSQGPPPNFGGPGGFLRPPPPGAFPPRGPSGPGNWGDDREFRNLGPPEGPRGNGDFRGPPERFRAGDERRNQRWNSPPRNRGRNERNGSRERDPARRPAREDRPEPRADRSGPRDETRRGPRNEDRRGSREVRPSSPRRRSRTRSPRPPRSTAPRSRSRDRSKKGGETRSPARRNKDKESRKRKSEERTVDEFGRDLTLRKKPTPSKGSDGDKNSERSKGSGRGSLIQSGGSEKRSERDLSRELSREESTSDKAGDVEKSPVKEKEHAAPVSIEDVSEPVSP